MNYDLIIFDCDGTLVNTETLSNSLISVMLREVGLNISESESIALFRGKSFSTITDYIDKHLDHRLEFNFEESFRQRSQILFEADLKAMDCAEGFIQKLNIPICIASNGPQIKMKTTLKVTGLDKYFNAENTFSAYDINKFKPEPDLFLYACKRMNGIASKTLVIEDTMVGAVAARAAGMDVLIYAPDVAEHSEYRNCLLYTSPSPRDATLSRMPSSA